MGTIIVGTVVFGFLGLTAYNLYKDKKNGGGCVGCGSACNCAKKNKCK